MRNVDDFLLADIARALNIRLKKDQGNVVRLILKECNDQGVTDIRHVAYIIATAYHECRFKSIKEIRAKAGTEVWKMQEKYWHTGFYGRGLCQLTHRRNYEKFSEVVGINLVSDPDEVLNPEIGAKILVFGMKHGTFTSMGLYGPKKLSKYLNATTADWLGTRKIVNGNFQADKVKQAALAVLPVL